MINLLGSIERQTALQEIRRVLVVCSGGEQSELTANFQSLPYVVTYSNDIHTIAGQVNDQGSIVLLSCSLPQEASYQWLEQRVGADSDVPIIVLAPISEPQEVERHLALGADDFLFIPTTPALLQARIESTLATYNLRNRAQTHLKDEATLKLEHDLQVARRIQAGFLPRSLPQVKGWEISARFQPAREVAGDFYDAFMLSQNRRIAFVIADVVDKGVPAALFMALVRSLTRAFAQQNYSINWSELLGGGSASGSSRRKPQKRVIPSTGTVSLYNAVLLTNNYIIDNHIDDNMFATLFFGLLDPSNGQLAYINAGHNPPFVLDGCGTLKAALKNTGAAVGMFPGVDYNIEFTQMEPGDILYAYTDGVTEARNAAGEFLTEKGLLALLAEPATSATALLDRIDIHLKTFMDNAEQFDDITMMAIQYAKE
jgi:sigma-B regulation protein RsbU (phosphoserine phosphatase)